MRRCWSVSWQQVRKATGAGVKFANSTWQKALGNRANTQGRGRGQVPWGGTRGKWGDHKANFKGRVQEAEGRRQRAEGRDGGQRAACLPHKVFAILREVARVERLPTLNQLECALPTLHSHSHSDLTPRQHIAEHSHLTHLTSQCCHKYAGSCSAKVFPPTRLLPVILILLHTCEGKCHSK